MLLMMLCYAPDLMLMQCDSMLMLIMLSIAAEAMLLRRFNDAAAVYADSMLLLMM
jgi:hypothetical protein